MKTITWRFWAAWAVLLGAYFALGSMPRFQARWDLDIYEIGLTATVVVAVVFVVAYTVIGFTQDAHRWWKTDIGTSLMVVTMAMLPSFGSLAWAFDFNGGVIKPGWLAWVALSGPLIMALALAWRSVVWLRAIVRQRNRSSMSGETLEKIP